MSRKQQNNQDKSKVQRQTPQENSSEAPSNLNRSTSASSLQRSDSNSSSSSVPNGKSNTSNASTVKASIPSRGNDPIRNRCIDMIASSLKCDERPDFDAAPVSAEIEDAIFRMFKDTGTKYKNRVKSKVMNLRNKRNSHLVLLVIDGEISPERFANMTAEEMACDDLKKERSEMIQQAIKDHQLAKNAGTSTGQFKCGKCGKRKTSYNQVQTRSADEPMTTFVYCHECGHRWKFC